MRVVPCLNTERLEKQRSTLMTVLNIKFKDESDLMNMIQRSGVYVDGDEIVMVPINYDVSLIGYYCTVKLRASKTESCKLRIAISVPLKLEGEWNKAKGTSNLPITFTVERLTKDDTTPKIDIHIDNPEYTMTQNVKIMAKSIHDGLREAVSIGLNRPLPKAIY